MRCGETYERLNYTDVLLIPPTTNLMVNSLRIDLDHACQLVPVDLIAFDMPIYSSMR